MPLSSEHIPLPCSLRDAVTRRFPQSAGDAGRETLTRDQLIRLLGKLGDDATSPLISLRRQAESEGASGSLEPVHGSIVEWLTLSFDHWEDHYPLEQKLALELRKLLPLAIALAVSDEHFLTPGAHPLHQLLDCLQHSAVGWQERLDRAGQMLEQRVMRAVVRAREWFEDRSVDFAHITRELTAAAERDAARAQRMVQRLAEAEAASLKTEQVRRDAASVINSGLEKYQLPAAIGEFLKGPWFDSAQLVALRFGTDSHEWRQVRRATEHLMESVQPHEETDDANRDRLANIVKRLPQELREWLLSLQHDPDAADDAIGLVEYAHLRLRHGQNLGLTRIPPIAVADSRTAVESHEQEAVELSNGHWFLMQDDQGELRAQLTLQLENGQHLLFTNVVGLKALDLRRDEFLRRLRENRARPLPAEDSFSLSLASTAGVDSNEKLRALIDPSFVPEPIDSDVIDAEDIGPEIAEPAHPEDSDALAGHRPEHTAPTFVEEEWEDPLPGLNRGADRPAADPAIPEIESLELTLAEDSDAGSPSPPVHPDNAAVPATDLREQVSSPRDRPPQRTRENRAPVSQPPRSDRGGAAFSERQDTAASGSARGPGTEPEIDVPMGAWLGFHDGETPIMAKLAVYDPRRDNYIFVNRRGIALRELSRSELLGLIDEGLVDILETRSYFRDEVQRARGQHHD